MASNRRDGGMKRRTTHRILSSSPKPAITGPKGLSRLPSELLQRFVLSRVEWPCLRRLACTSRWAAKQARSAAEDMQVLRFGSSSEKTLAQLVRRTPALCELEAKHVHVTDTLLFVVSISLPQ